jgi:cytochrome c oxidase assembly factor CtaG
VNSGPATFIALTAVAYALAIRACRPRQRPANWRVGAFMAGLAALGLSLASPLDGLSADLFSAHMLQHMLLSIAAPPLLALGHPLHVGLQALPASGRHVVARALVRPSWYRGAVAVMVHPLALLLAVNVPLIVWHVPWIYELALADRLVHDLEHLTFLGPPALFWLVLFEPTVPRDRRPSVEGVLLVLFATWMACDLLGATLALSGMAWYTAYTDTLRWGLSAPADQRLGGLVMWVGGGIFYGAVMLVILIRAVHVQSARARVVSGHGRPAPLTQKRPSPLP